MQPFLAFAAIPIAVFCAWFISSNWSWNDSSRYQLPYVQELEEPRVPTAQRTTLLDEQDIRLQAFLPHAPDGATAVAPSLILRSVMTGSGVSIATINGRVVKEGDRLEGYSVRRISDNGVELVGRGTKRWLPMLPLHELPPVARG